MTLLELHIALANSLGDPVVYNTAGTTKDQQLLGNVRYSVANREAYLFRAMSKLYADAMTATAERTRVMQCRILQNWFPTSTKLVADSIDDYRNTNPTLHLPDMFFPYSLAVRMPKIVAPFLGHLYGKGIDNPTDPLEHGHFIGGVNVPIYTSDEAYNRSTSRGILDSAPYAYLAGYTEQSVNGYIGGYTVLHIMSNRFFESLYEIIRGDSYWHEQSWLRYEVTYLPQIPDLSQLPLLSAVAFEPTYFNDIIKYATLFGQVDSQEVEVVGQATQILYAKHFTLEPAMQQMGGGYGGV